MKVRRKSNWEMPYRRAGARVHTRYDIQEGLDMHSTANDLVSNDSAGTGDCRDVPCSCAGIGSVNTPSSLGLFITSTNQEMERLVEREYQVIDGNGEVLKGRKARYGLRRDVNKVEYGQGQVEADVEDGDFVLL